MRSTTLRNYKHRRMLIKKMRESHTAISRHKKPALNTKVGSISGALLSKSNVCVDAVNRRIQVTVRSKRIKPSMPIMPWDKSK